MLGDTLHDGKVALAFLTRVPVRLDREWQQADLAASVAAFPLVGLLVGLAGGLIYLVAFALGLPPVLAAVLAIAAQAWSTGAMHEDGLGDLADGLGGATREKRLAILRDPRVGSFGVIAIVLALMARAGGIAELEVPGSVIAALVTAGAISRAAMPAAMLVLPQAREDGLAARAGRPHASRVAAGAVISLLIAFLLLPPLAALVATVCGALAGTVVAVIASRQLGGVTGDVLGAIQQLVEVSVLFAIVALA